MTKTLKIKSAKVPRQERSVKTHNALLDAAERLLKKQPWEQISTVAIMLEAGVSNGAIYGRFKSKDDLLVALYERHDEKLRERFGRQETARLPQKGETIGEFLEREIDHLVEVLTENRWLLRAMGILSRQKPAVVNVEMRSDRRLIFERIVARFAPFEHAVKGPDPKRQLELAVFMVSTFLREALLYPGPHFDSLDLGNRELKESVKRMALGFLGVEPGVRGCDDEIGRAGEGR